ncbi:uncharacterized protein [Arachis hypogaea]|uniref:uncharacterized protein isoform X3 n=1 Tax=Arachis hypogaea TaxID=3818 RepID=UPI003B22030D|nr:RNA polymerase I-specific transcription initiation factor [Arachis hypogaea]
MLAERPAAEYLNRKILEGKTIAEKLDSLIELTFLHLESCQSSGQLSEVFDVLVRSFQRTILFQFVVFYACALDPEDCGEKFAMVLVHFFLFPFFHSCAISCFWFLWSTQNVQILLGRLLMDVLKYQLVQFASRLDPDRSGILTTLCDHSFQCPYVSKWTYLSCQEGSSLPYVFYISALL